MSDSDSDDGGPGLEGILWGNLGEGDRLEVDYLDETAVSALGAVSNKVGLGAALLKEVSVAGGASSSAAAAAGSDGAGAGQGVDYADEPTLPEDLEDEDIPALRPAAAPSAARAMQLAAGAYNQRVAGEDDYDDDDAGPAAPAAAARAVQAQQQQQPQQAPSLQLPYGMAAAGVASSAQLQHLAALHQLQQQQPGMQLSQIQQLHLQQLQQQQQQQHLQQVSSLPSPVAAAVLQAAAQSPPPQQQQLRRPQLTPEQERLRELNKANTAQEAAQEALSFVYLDLDEMGEDIIHFSELFGFTDNMIKNAFLTSFAKVPPPDKGHAQHDQPWDAAAHRARQRAERQLNSQQVKALQAQQASTDTGGLAVDVADDEAEKFHKGDVAAAAAEGNVVQLGLQNIRQEVVEELSDPEDELFYSDPKGLGRAMLQATRINAARAAAQAAAAAAAARNKAAAAGEPDDAGDEEAPADTSDSQTLQGLAAGMQGLGLKGLAANPHALDALQADILPDWEQEVHWGSSAPPPAIANRTAPLPAMQHDQQLALQPSQQQQQPVGLGLPGSQASITLPGMSSAIPGLPPAATLGLPPAPTGLPGTLSSGLPPGSLGLPGGSLLSQPTGGQDALGHLSVLSGQQGLHDAAAAAATSIPDAAAAAAAAAAAGGAKGKAGGRGGKHGKGASVTLGKPRRPLDVALADLKLHRHMLRLMPSIAAAAATLTAAEAMDAAAAAAAAAAASGDRAAAAALPQRVSGSKTAAGLGTGSEDVAAAAEQLRLKHVGDLLQRDLKPVLPDDDDWMNDIVWDAQDEAARAATGITMSSMPVAADRLGLAEQQQQALVVRQQLGVAGAGRGAVLWDLNDPHMVFEAHTTQPFVNASAMMHPAPPQPVVHPPPHLLAEKDPLLRLLAPLHISRDHLYTVSERAAGRTTGTGKHSQLAVGLQTVPLFPKDAMTPFWHRPYRSWWSAAHLLYCLEEERRKKDPRAPTDRDPFKIETIGLNLRKGPNATADFGDVELAEVWNVAIANSRIYKDALAVEMPRLRGLGPFFDLEATDDSWMGTWLELKGKNLLEQGFKRGPNTIIPVWSLVQPLKTQQVAGLLPPDMPCRPPAAFKTTKSLSATSPGHVLLLEYLEERPLMLLQPGMGVRLTTYYRRKNDSDMHYQALQAEYSEGLLARQALPLTSADRFDARPPWMVGTPQLLTPDDTSPFYELAPIPPGEMQYAVDTPCFRAPAVPHVASASDFLLVRLPGGNIALRELTGCVTVGQQHPSVLIWAPFSAEALAYEKARFKAYVIRTLRQRADRPKVKSGEQVAMVSMLELQVAFQSMSFGNEPEQIARMLREECGCEPLAKHPGYWTFAPTAKLPSESELRREVTPDHAVQYEALLAGLGQRNSWGIEAAADQIARLLEATGGPPAATLRLVLDMLLPNEAGRQAAAAIEQCVLNPPWAQSAAYQSALRDVRNPTAMTLIGRGDPTGRGRGFAFTREDPKKAKEDAANAQGVKAQADGSITGTDADLRRLGHKRAGELLMTKFGMDADTVAGLARWDRIDAIRRAVREPANNAIVNADPELQQYVRNVKQTADDMKVKMRNVAAGIFAAQMNVLHEPWNDDALSEDMSWGPAQKLAQATMADELADTATTQAVQNAQLAYTAAADAGDPAALAAAEAALQQAQSEVLLPAGPGLCRGHCQNIELGVSMRGPTGASRGLPRGQEALPGERRIRRIITCITANQSTVKRTMVISSREEVAALNALYKQGDGFGERTITFTNKFGRNRAPGRQIKLGEAWTDAWPAPDIELPEPPLSEKLAKGQGAATAAAAAAGGSAAAWASGPDPGVTASAAAAVTGYGGYGLQPGPEVAGWGQQQPVAPAAPAARAPKLTKKQKQQQAAKARQAAAAMNKKGKRKRRNVDFGSEDESYEISDSEDDAELAELAEGSDDDDGGSPQARAKRPRPVRASAGGVEPAAAAAAAPAAAAVGAVVVPAAIPPAVVPPDTAKGAAEGASARMIACLQELAVLLKKGVERMIKHQGSKARTNGYPNLFVNPVSPAMVADYEQWVPMEKQMWLNRIKERVARSYYGSRQQLLADAEMIVQAARSYHTIGRGRQATPAIITLAQSTVTEGGKAWDDGEDKGGAEYWEARVQIEAARQRGPEAFKQCLQEALQYAETISPDAPQGWHWVQCDACTQWRLVSGACYYEKGFYMDEVRFKCDDNLDRPGTASCQEPGDWVEG